jgi:SNF2 family DNA or RNA helicase
MINGRRHQNLLCVQVARKAIEGDVARRIRGRWSKDWNCIVAHWTSFNCARLLETAYRFGWFGKDAQALAEIEYMAWPVIMREPALFPGITQYPNISLDEEGENALKYVEQRHLSRPLWRHQRQAFKTLYRLNGAMLDMGMGTGKTMTTIALICHGKHDFGMVVCPKAVIDVWPLEFQKNCKTPFVIYTGTGKKSQTITKYVAGLEKSYRNAEVMKRPFLFVCNYEAMWQGHLKEFISMNKFDYVVFDEVHRLKSPSGVASKFAAKMRTSALRIFGCTGTLLPHSPLDAFGSFRAVDPAVFGDSYIPFRSTYAEMGEIKVKQKTKDGKEKETSVPKVKKFKNKEQMHRLITSISFRVKTEDAVDLPPATHIIRKCSLAPATRKIYMDMANELVADFEGNTLTAANALVKVVRLMQITSGVIRDADNVSHRIGNEKASLFEDVLEDIAPEEPIVVFCRFTADIQAAKEVAEKLGRPASELSGKKNELKAWQAGETNTLVVQIKAGKEGVDFTRARYCFYYSMTHSLGEYEQSLRRPHRPGQERAVFFIHLVAEDTIDEDIYAGLEKKKKIVLSVLEGVARSATKNEEQARRILRKAESMFATESEDEDADT